MQPKKLRLLIEGHAVVTVAFQGWSGLKNGALLTAALSTNNWDHVKTAIATIMAAINAVTPGSYAEVNISE